MESPSKCVRFVSALSNQTTIISVIYFILKQYVPRPVHSLSLWKQDMKNTELIYIHRISFRFNSQHIYLVHCMYFDFELGLFQCQILPWFIPSMKQCLSKCKQASQEKILKSIFTAHPKTQKLVCIIWVLKFEFITWLQPCFHLYLTVMHLGCFGSLNLINEIWLFVVNR